MTRILVVGGSRGIGLEVCRIAIERGHFVRSVSRAKQRADSLPRNFESFKGDALNPDDISRSLEGMDVVVQALGVPQSLDFILKPVTLFSKATRVLLPAMMQAGISKLVSVTGFGAGDSRDAINFLQRPAFELIFRNAYNDKSTQERLIEESDLAWLIVRPGVLMNWPTSGKYTVLTRPREWRNGIVARADVADFIVKRIEADTLNKEKPVIIRYPL